MRSVVGRQASVVGLRGRMPSRQPAGRWGYPGSHNFVLVVVDGFGEADPDVEEAEPTAEPAEKSEGHDAMQSGIVEQQGIIGPLLGPGQNNKQYARRGADENEKQHQQAMHPDLAARGAG